MQANPAVRTGFVSTNSICQGEQVGLLWGDLLRLGASIHFAHRTFKWSNEGKGVAAVHCIIIGFALQPPIAPCRIFDYSADIKGEPVEAQAKRINPYLVDAPITLIEKRSTALAAPAELAKGSEATDFGYLFIETAEELNSILEAEPHLANCIKRVYGGDELINNLPRWCFWLVGANPSMVKQSPELQRRLAAVRTERLKSAKPRTQEWANKPGLFSENRQPKQPYIAVPKVSSERRQFMPIGFLPADAIATGSLLTIDSPSLFLFGILQSTMHMAWMRTVAGRLESRYQYSASVVYNNYPWPQSINEKQKAAIETAAQAVLDARARYPEATLADLYDPLTMPFDLVQAHHQLDRAVDAAYAYKGGKDDAPRVAFLFALYSQLAAPLDVQAKAGKTTKPKRK
jgi:hypothetical protein